MRLLSFGAAVAISAVWAAGQPASEAAENTSPKAPASESLVYEAEWRLIHAGDARLEWKSTPGGWHSTLRLDSAGLVSRLYKINNEYSSSLKSGFCADTTLLKTNEGSKRRETTVTYDPERLKAKYVERDLVKNTVADTHELDVQACEHDVVGALYRLRSMDLAIGQSAQIPISDGKKAVMGRVEAQARESVSAGGRKYNTIRYEAHLFNGVLYRRRGRLFVWLTDDARRLPVQIQVRMQFYIGTVTLQLKQEGTGK